MKIHVRFAIAALTAITALSLAACGDKPAAGYQGYVEGEYLYLAAPQGGYLDTLQAVRGSRVVAGAMVFTVAADTEQAGVKEAEAREQAAREKVNNLSAPRRQSEVAALAAQLHVAEAALRLSETQVSQQQALAARGFVSSARLDEARAARARDAAQVEAARQQLASYRDAIGRAPEVRAAEADVDAAQAQLAQKRWQLEKKAVTAPAAGEIADVYYRPGEWVPAGAAVASLLPDTRRRLRFFVPEPVLATLKPGQAVEARCDGCAEPVRATIDFISPEAEYTPPVIYSRESREKLVFRIEAAPLPDQRSVLRPGLPVDVRLLDR